MSGKAARVVLHKPLQRVLAAEASSVCFHSPSDGVRMQSSFLELETDQALDELPILSLNFSLAVVHCLFELGGRFA